METSDNLLAQSYEVRDEDQLDKRLRLRTWAIGIVILATVHVVLGVPVSNDQGKDKKVHSMCWKRLPPDPYSTDHHVWTGEDLLYVDGAVMIGGYFSDFCRTYSARRPTPSDAAGYARARDGLAAARRMDPSCAAGIQSDMDR